MPIPKPSSGEKEGEFVSRCISTLTNTGEFEDGEQRQAVCHTAWRDAKGLPQQSSKGRKGIMSYLDRFRKWRRDKMTTATQYHGEIGARVQKLREEKGMTQEELAQRMSNILDPEAGTGTGGIDVSTIGQIETGDIDVPSQPVIAAFAEALDTTVGALEGLLGKDEEPGSGRFSGLKRDLVYHGTFKPRVTKQDNGKFTIHRVPIFMEHDDRGWNCDAKWMKGAVQKQRQNSRKGVLPRLIIGHTDEDKGEQPAVAALDNFTHSTSDGTLYADFTNVPGGLIDQFKDNNWPGRSAEVYPEDHEISAVALLGGTPPFFKLPDLRLNSKRDHAGEPVLYSMEVKPMSKPNKTKNYMDEAHRDEIVQVVTEVVKDVVAEELNDFRRSFAGHDDDPPKDPEHNALHDPEEDAKRKKEKEEEEANKMSNNKLAQQYAKLEKNNDAMATRLIELEDTNERGRWTQQYSEQRIPAGRLDVQEHVGFIMKLPSALREDYFKKSLQNLQGPATEATHLADAAAAAGCAKGSVGEAEAVSRHYQAHKDKFGGDMMAALRDYRLQLANGNGKD